MKINLVLAHVTVLRCRAVYSPGKQVQVIQRADNSPFRHTRSNRPQIVFLRCRRVDNSSKTVQSMATAVHCFAASDRSFLILHYSGCCPNTSGFPNRQFKQNSKQKIYKTMDSTNSFKKISMHSPKSPPEPLHVDMYSGGGSTVHLTVHTVCITIKIYQN